MHLCQRFFQSLTQFLNSISGIAFKAFFDSACIPSMVSKRCPRSGLLSFENSQKSHGAELGEYKISFETVLSDPFEMPIVSARSLITIDDFCALILWFDWRVARQLMLMVVQGVPSHQHVLSLLWSLCTPYKHFSATWSNPALPDTRSEIMEMAC